MANPRHLTQLRQKLDTHFDEEELRTLCFDLGAQYENLPGRGKANKARELVALFERNERIEELVDYCSKSRPTVTWTYQAQLFIAYKRYANADQALATFLHQLLVEQEHLVFIDKSMRTGADWLEEIDRQIKAADFLVVLLSEESAGSEMLQSEVRRAYSYQKQQGHPSILPVRIDYEGLLPYAIDAFLDPIQYVTWHSVADNEHVGQEILTAIDGNLSAKEPFPFARAGGESVVSEDGLSLSDSELLQPPLPEFDPRLLSTLTAPGGAVKLRDKLYVKRSEDVRLRQEIVKWGTTVTIRAPRQTGKTSLLMRGLYDAGERGAKTVFFDVQSLGSDRTAHVDTFLRELAESICRELRLDESLVENAWQSSLAAQKKMTYLLEDNILPAFNVPIVIALDEADSLLETDYYKDVFSLLRSWHNRRAMYEVWEKLNIVLVISTEPYLLIDDINQSPFNVGLRVELPDFDETQVIRLNQQHGSPVPENELPNLMKLLNGHPYLTRKYLYALVTGGSVHNPAADEGPFGDHLRRLLWNLRDQPELQAALKEIIRTNRCSDDSAVFRLLRAGLIKGRGNVFTCRCDLYRQYFESKLS